MRSGILGIALLLALALGGTDLGCAADRPNVLFLAVDDLKPSLGCYGDQTAKSPAIDALAASGTVFLNAHCGWPVCGPSRASLMTSLRPEAVGVMDLKTDMRARHADVLTLPQVFRQAGYATVARGKIYDPRCVDSKEACDAPSWSLPYAAPPYSRLLHSGAKDVVLAPEVDDSQLFDGAIADQGIEQMRVLAESGTPFFLAVGFKKPHLPFIAPKKYFDLFDPAGFPLAEHQGGIEDDSGYLIHDSPELRGYDGTPAAGEPILEQDARRYLHGYYACVAYIDAQIARLLAELDRLDLRSNTVIVLWGDHGFHLGDHSMWGKHSALEHATRSPLIVVPPGGTKLRTSMAPVELIDIYPTLLELADLDLPTSIHGRSLAPILRGEAASVRKGALTVFKKQGALGYSYRTERHRYTEWINKAGDTVATDLFDYQKDPLEKANLASREDKAQLLERLGKALRREGAGCERLGLK